MTFTRTFPQPADAMWSALTDPGELPQWAPYTADRDLGSIGPATLIMLDRQERLEVDGTVTIADVSAVLEHAWGDDRLRWELVPCVNGTELTCGTLSTSLSSSPQWRPAGTYVWWWPISYWPELRSVLLSGATPTPTAGSGCTTSTSRSWVSGSATGLGGSTGSGSAAPAGPERPGPFRHR